MKDGAQGAEADSSLLLDRSLICRSTRVVEASVELHENMVVLQKKGYLQLSAQVKR